MKKNTKYLFLFLILFVFSSSAFSKTLKIGTYNIRNFGNKTENSEQKNQVIIKQITNLNADIVALEEVVMRDVLQNLVDSRLKNYSVVMSKCGGGGIQHLAFLYKKSTVELLQVKELNDIKTTKPDVCYSGSRPLFMAQFKLKFSGSTFWAAAIHLKAGGRNKNIEQRHKQIDLLSNFLKYQSFANKVILLGDFNTTEFIVKGEFYDHFMSSFDKIKYTNVSESKISCSSYWWGSIKDETMYPSQLDHIINSSSFKNKFGMPKITQGGHCKKFNCKPIADIDLPDTYNLGSDHCAMMAEYTFF